MEGDSSLGKYMDMCIRVVLDGAGDGGYHTQASGMSGAQVVSLGPHPGLAEHVTNSSFQKQLRAPLERSAPTHCSGDNACSWLDFYSL